MDDSTQVALRAAVEALHGCSAVFRNVEVVRETFQGQLAWEREVATFELANHATANTAYAWLDQAQDSTKQRHYAVLALGAVQSPLEAVRASIVQTIRETREPL